MQGLRSSDSHVTDLVRPPTQGNPLYVAAVQRPNFSHQCIGLTKKISSPGFGDASTHPQTFAVTAPNRSTCYMEKDRRGESGGGAWQDTWLPPMILIVRIGDSSAVCDVKRASVGASASHKPIMSTRRPRGKKEPSGITFPDGPKI